MTLTDILEITIGLSVFYFLASVLVSNIVELLMALCKVRAKALKEWFDANIDGKVKWQQLVSGAPTNANDNGSAPSYVSSEDFAAAVLTWLRSLDSGTGILSETGILHIKTLLSTRKSEFLAKLIGSLSPKADLSWEELKPLLQSWYDRNMDRLRGVVSRTAQVYTISIAIVVCFLFNLDTIMIGEYLLQATPETRLAVIEKAHSILNDEALQQEFNRTRKDQTRSNNTAAPDERLRNTWVQTQVGNMNTVLLLQEQVKADLAGLSTTFPIGWKVRPCCYFFAGVNVPWGMDKNQVVTAYKAASGAIAPGEQASQTPTESPAPTETPSGQNPAPGVADQNNSTQTISPDLNLSSASNPAADPGTPAPLQSETNRTSDTPEPPKPSVVSPSVTSPYVTWGERLRKILGLFVTVLAISLGAPFWFDMLNKLTNIRLTGKPLPTASDLEEARKKQLAKAGAKPEGTVPTS